MTTAISTNTRALVDLHIPATWTRHAYGEGPGREYVWQAPEPARLYTEKVVLSDGELTYRRRDERVRAVAVRVDGEADVVAFLRLAGLVEEAS